MQCVLLTGYGIHLEVLLCQHICQMFFQFHDLIYHQNPLSVPAAFRVSFHSSRCKRQINRKGTSRTHFAGDGNGASHQFCKILCNRKSQPGTAVLPDDPAVFLCKGLKNAVDILRSNPPSGIPDGETEPYPILVTPKLLHIQADIPLCRRKLYRIGKKIGQYLIQAKRIAHQIFFNLTVEENLKVNLLAYRLNMKYSRQGTQKPSQVKLLRMQLYFSAFYFGHVQDIVNQGKQMR